jgi:hypothetical protein
VSTLSPPVVVGKGRCALAPLNTCYPAHASHRAAAGCALPPPTPSNVDLDKWASHVIVGPSVGPTAGPEDRVMLLPPDQFYELRVPFYPRDDALVAQHRATLPRKHREQLEGTVATARRLREALAPSSIVDEATRQEFAEQVEQRFLEWMRDTGADRQVEHLLDM